MGLRIQVYVQAGARRSTQVQCIDLYPGVCARVGYPGGCARARDILACVQEQDTWRVCRGGIS